MAGTSGSGKSTLAARIAAAIAIPYVEIDGLFHGPGWTPKASFDAEVDRFSSGPNWVTEWQYSQARPLLAQRADLMVWLDLSRLMVLRQVTARTLRRRLRREVLWNGNTEQPLRTFLTDRDHIVRWAWKTHAENADRVRALCTQRPNLPVVQLRSHREAAEWLTGPLRAASTAR